MNARIFLDTNIFVYALDESAGEKCHHASRLIKTAIQTRKGTISYQVVQEFFHLALRRFAKPMNAAEAAQYLGTVFRPLWTVQSSEALCLEALRLCEAHRLSWYDSLIIAAAVESNCAILYSEDLQHGRRFGNTKVVNPFFTE